MYKYMYAHRKAPSHTGKLNIQKGQLRKHADTITHTDRKITHTGVMFCTTYVGQVLFR